MCKTGATGRPLPPLEPAAWRPLRRNGSWKPKGTKPDSPLGTFRVSFPIPNGDPMSTPSAAFLLLCPTCGKKYKGNPEKPNARYKCPADQSELVRPEAAAQAPPPPAPTPEYETTQRITTPSPD